MKRLFYVAFLLVAAVAWSGCGKSSDQEGGSTSTSVDTSALTSQFAGAEGAVKAAVDQVVAAVNSGRFSDAVASLHKLASEPGLSPRQQAAVATFLDQVKAAATAAGQKVEGAIKSAADAVGKTAEDASKAVGDAAKGLAK
jgi:hypothetical protein